ncbi:MAG: hypothetical protein ACKPHQ_19905, partial [Dolichospermum sp.]
TGDYKVDKNGLHAADLLSEKHPHARLFGIKIGYNVAAAFGGGIMERVSHFYQLCSHLFQCQ